jgi:hypothetical protein
MDTVCTEKDILNGVKDEYGVVYSKDGKRLLTCEITHVFFEYQIRPNTEIICDSAFF